MIKHKKNTETTKIPYIQQIMPTQLIRQNKHTSVDK